MNARLDWDSLQTVLAIARAGRLTVAARQLAVDHSTLSRRITHLEKSLQARLFDRSPSGYVLTPHGERLRETAEAVERLIVAGVADISGADLRVAGTVRIGATEGFGTMFLAPRLGQLGRMHPNLTLQLVTLPRLFSLSKREADVVIGLAPPEHGRLHARKITDYELGLYGSWEYLSSTASILRRDQLPGCSFIGYTEDLIYAHELDYLPEISPEIRPFLTSSNLLAQWQATAAGHGLCVLPCFMADTDARLVRVLPDHVALVRAFWLIVPTDMRNLRHIRVLCDFIAEETRNARDAFLPKRGSTSTCGK